MYKQLLKYLVTSKESNNLENRIRRLEDAVFGTTNNETVYRAEFPKPYPPVNPVKIIKLSDK